MSELVSDVFKTAGQPNVTYVKRDSGNLERKLSGYLDEKGLICLITGPSKTGKTTLYKKVLADRGQIPLIVRCTKDRTVEDIWKLALEAVDFQRVSSVSERDSRNKEVQLSGEGKIGWQWLANITGKAVATARSGDEEGTVRERILAKPSPDLLIPILQSTNYVLIIEDFHYLIDDE